MAANAAGAAVIAANNKLFFIPAAFGSAVDDQKQIMLDGEAMGIGSSDAGVAVTTTNNSLYLVSMVDVDSEKRCDLNGVAGAIVVKDTNVAVSVGNQIATVDGSGITDATDCGETPVITTPPGSTKFGERMLLGNFDGDSDANDLVVTANNAVYVYMNFPTTNTMTTIPTPPGSVAFGAAIAVGDLDGDSRDELVIGDPMHVIGAHPEAGKAYIYGTSTTAGEFEEPIVLHDTRAEDNQRFGQSLAVTSANKLIVGAHNEVFTYVRTPLAGDVDFRN